MSCNNTFWPKVVLFGDSLVQNGFDPVEGKWGALLAHRLRGFGDVLNRGFSGYNSRFCRKILPHLFSDKNSSEIQAFVILVGTNDCSGSEADQQTIPLEEYKENLVAIINYITEIGIAKEKIILLTFPPYSDEKYSDFCQEIGRFKHFRDVKVMAQYVQTCVDIANEHDIEVINIHEEMIKEEDWPDYLVEGLHLGAKGSEKVYELLLPSIEKRVDVTKSIFPYWREFDDTKF